MHLTIEISYSTDFVSKPSKEDLSEIKYFKDTISTVCKPFHINPDIKEAYSKHEINYTTFQYIYTTTISAADKPLVFQHYLIVYLENFCKLFQPFLLRGFLIAKTSQSEDI